MVILIRHAEAGDAVRDDARPLTALGRADSLRLGQFLGAAGVLRGFSFWHSSYLRARETAELVVARAGGPRPAPLREVEGLTPNDSPREIAARIAAHDGDVAIFGHNPQLTLLATLLVKGAEAKDPVAAFEKCSGMALGKLGEGGPGEWYVCWHLAPELLRGKA